MQERYGLVVLGAGPGGYMAALKAAKLGVKVAVVENRELGGTCLNRGCIPTKTLLHAGSFLLEARHFEAIGLQGEGLDFDIGKIHERKNEVVQKLRGGIEQLFKANKIDLFQGTGTLCSAETVQIKSTDGILKIKGDKILIATGAQPIRPVFEGSDLPNVVTSDELLQVEDHVYNSLVIIGGGVIGVEFATLYNALGCEVTIIEAMDRLLPSMDREISQNLSMILKKRGIKIHTSSRLEKIEQSEGLLCTYTEKEQLQTLPTEAVLIAVGRMPNTQHLFSEEFTLEMSNNRIVVDEQFRTSVPAIYAIGDVISTLQLAHLATAQGITAVEHMLSLKPTIDLNTVPGCVYIQPEIATVGLTADEAKAKGIEVHIGKMPLSSNARTLIEMQDRSFIKVIADANTHVVLGAQLMCARATDLVSEFSAAISAQLTIEQLAAVIRPHPTFSEAITEAVDQI